MTLLHEVCTLCVSLGFVEHTLALCYYFVHYGLSLWVVVVPILLEACLLCVIFVGCRMICEQ